MEFVADVHSLSKVKSQVRGTVGLNQDTLGAILKAALSQFLALEIVRLSADKVVQLIQCCLMGPICIFLPCFLT